MKKLFRFGSALAALSVMGMLNPVSAVAGGPVAAPAQRTAAHQKVVDVALHQNGTLMGKVVTPTGAVMPKSMVQISQKGKVVQTVHTDENGVFVANGMRGGVYDVRTTQSARQVRAWAPGAAPPAAQPGVLVVENVQPNVVRGQIYEPSPLDLNANGSITEEVIVGAAVIGGATAAVIIAVDDDDDGSP